MNTQVLIEKLTQALSYKFPNDRMMPGVTISYLRSGVFYVSLVRWTPDKTVVHKAEGATLNAALETVARHLTQSKAAPNPLDELNDALNPLPKIPAWPCPDPHAYETKGPKPKLASVKRDDDDGDLTFPDYSLSQDPGIY